MPGRGRHQHRCRCHTSALWFVREHGAAPAHGAGHVRPSPRCAGHASHRPGRTPPRVQRPARVSGIRLVFAVRPRRNPAERRPAKPPRPRRKAAAARCRNSPRAFNGSLAHTI
ncbi:hypothetical protein SLNWT_0706 [Streptomyces albus]|uniref:Uncharacterized protein n=1 Tax=Streptomyces albus (strain ATCC 21838 / DSM 41398 / FERM P-419 / JCM 4703 / NBRC 107858) TaxID=1081613 RepID=A0A0B5ESH2_STRA4|nr:hypothetical protein SLNWT_0706 [Streptomyces albus]AOU75395.1 hypothetical protein SLNHY_0704 [Streptomyces albus]AYN31199.1 hypothetical protein DUI70_0697 [Streptomyces albus]